MSTVLVTGGSGFVGSHVMLQLLEAGHLVRATVRSLSREAGVRAMLRDAGVDAGQRLTFLAADLERDEGWAGAVAGCDYVIHVASPMPAAAPRHEDELIVPARDGVLRVLKAARDARVKRVVVTSSCGAVYYGHPPRVAPFDEASWTLLPLLDNTRRATSAKAQRLLGWTPRPREEAIVSTAESLLKFGIVPG
jgi:nucleoside-diphosphate-sugar epimerase